MAHFAELDENNVVLRVVVVNNEEVPDEATGTAFVASLFGGRWVQCSYNNNMRKQYPHPGYKYDQVADQFVKPQPYPSWTLDANNDWQAPVPYPGTPDDFVRWAWHEDTQTWEYR